MSFSPSSQENSSWRASHSRRTTGGEWREASSSTPRLHSTRTVQVGPTKRSVANFTWGSRIICAGAPLVAESVPPTPVPFNLTLYKGAKSYRLTRKFVEFLLTHPVARAFTAWAATTAVPDEMVVASLARVSRTQRRSKTWIVQQAANIQHSLLSGIEKNIVYFSVVRLTGGLKVSYDRLTAVPGLPTGGPTPLPAVGGPVPLQRHLAERRLRARPAGPRQRPPARCRLSHRQQVPLGPSPCHRRLPGGDTACSRQPSTTNL